MSVDLVCGIAAHKHAVHVGLARARFRIEDVPLVVEVDEPLEDVRVGFVPNRHEEARCRNDMLFACDVVFHLHPVHGLFAEDLDRFRVVQDLDVVEAVHAVLHGLGGTHDVATDEHGDLGAELGEVARLFARAVAGTHNHHFLVAVEEPIADGAGTHPAADVTKAKLAFEAEPLGRSTRADDHGVGVDFRLLVVAHPNLVHGAAEVHFRHPTVADVGVETFGLVFEVLHHLRTVDARRVAREIVDFSGLGELAAGLLSLVKNRFHVRTGGVDGGSVSGGPRSNDQAAVVFRSAHGLVSM